MLEQVGDLRVHLEWVLLVEEVRIEELRSRIIARSRRLRKSLPEQLTSKRRMSSSGSAQPPGAMDPGIRRTPATRPARFDAMDLGFHRALLASPSAIRCDPARSGAMDLGFHQGKRV